MNAIVEVSTEPRRLIEQVLDCADYNIFQNSRGKVVIHGGGVWNVPTYVLDESEIVSVGEASRAKTIWETSNEIKPVFTCPETRYSSLDAAPVIDSLGQSQIGAVYSETLDLPFVTSHDQARHLGKIALAYRRTRWVLKDVLCLISAIKAWDEIGVRVTYPPLGIENLQFKITNRKLSENFTTISFDLIEWGEDDLTWTNADYVAPPALPPVVSSPLLIETPQSFTITSTGTGSGQATLSFSWDPFGGEEGFIPVISYRAGGAGAYTDVVLASGVTSYTTGNLTAVTPVGTVYDAFFRWKTTPNGYFSGYETPVERIALDTDTPPVAVTSALPGSGSVSFTQPSSYQFWQTSIYVHPTGGSYDTATFRGTVQSAPSTAETFTHVSIVSGSKVYFRTENRRGEFTVGNIVGLSIP
jgi:hypothetical protein